MGRDDLPNWKGESRKTDACPRNRHAYIRLAHLPGLHRRPENVINFLARKHIRSRQEVSNFTNLDKHSSSWLQRSTTNLFTIHTTHIEI